LSTAAGKMQCLRLYDWRERKGNFVQRKEKENERGVIHKREDW